MFKSSRDTIEEFITVLKLLPTDCYDRSCDDLGSATIGKHTRHIIELYQCLLEGYESGQVSYDQRRRNREIEIDLNLAVQELKHLQNSIQKPDKRLRITYELNGEIIEIDSNYFREVMYNLEHAIHHHALIKVGIMQMTEIALPDSFGVAPSTLQFRKLCVQ